VSVGVLGVLGVHTSHTHTYTSRMERKWSIAGTKDGRFFVGGRVGGFLGSYVPIATWLNPHLTTGYAVEVSKFFNIQYRGMQRMLTSMVASGLPMEEARAVLGGLYY
jgi:hypothetical protein